MPEKKMGILYFGRFDDEKGFGIILDVLKMFIKKFGDLPFSFYVFGKGKYVSELLELAKKCNSIHFFGWQPISTIQRYKENCQFCLIPSLFLETFGLTALNSLSMGIPVIGFAKGGLSQFIKGQYDISKEIGETDEKKLFNKLSDIVENYKKDNIDIEKERKQAINLSKKYLIEKWFENFQEIFGKPKKIMIVSDFKSNLGGIETYIGDIKKILEEKGYEIKIYGTRIPGGKIGKYLKYFGISLAIFNIFDAIKLKLLVKKFDPKIVRYHSTIRWLGRLPINFLKKHDSKKIVMFHDFGYFHPYPSNVVDLSMIKSPLNLKNFIKSAETKNILKILAVAFKYLSACLIKNQFKKTTKTYLVPSDFMQKIVSESYKIDEKKVSTLSHFIQQ